MQPTQITPTADKIEITISGIEYSIERTLFEAWLTDSDGIVRHGEDMATLEEYWEFFSKVNDTPAKEHIGYFLRSAAGKGDLLRINKAVAMDMLMSYLSNEGLEALKAYNTAYYEYMIYYAS